MRKQRFHRRAWATLLWAGAAYAVLHAGLFLAVEHRLVEFRQVAGVKPLSESRFTILVLGSSRTANGLQAAALGNHLSEAQGRPVQVLNYGIFGAGPVTQLLCLRHLLSGGLKPDLVVVESVPTMLTDRGVAPLESILVPIDLLFRNELDVLRRYGFDEKELQTHEKQTLLSPWYAYRYIILNWAASSWVPMGKDAWWPRPNMVDWRPWLTQLDSPEKIQRAFKQAESEHSDNLRTFRMSESAQRAFREILETCRSENIPSALLFMPEGTAFRSWYPAETTRQLYALMHELGREFDAPLIDARDWVADDGFADSHHLLPAGATVFTERLGGEVLTPLLTNLPTRRATRNRLAAN